MFLSYLSFFKRFIFILCTRFAPGSEELPLPLLTLIFPIYNYFSSYRKISIAFLPHVRSTSERTDLQTGFFFLPVILPTLHIHSWHQVYNTYQGFASPFSSHWWHHIHSYYRQLIVKIILHLHYIGISPRVYCLASPSYP